MYNLHIILKYLEAERQPMAASGLYYGNFEKISARNPSIFNHSNKGNRDAALTVIFR